ncbi:hypothetical protein NW752_009515 [Fusarium irregulare]|uniref:Uncharacterized protein n=1 Tax=Fusarium irregulare TaxID=2494466 RepID=A0A9W8PFI3_9HYPO|nr:hypothetical protein NW766_011553 [Fusarium irregulare]KAJ4009216.1 hypothetical protein NW752_009515 [Fusarium irregulare]
MPTNKLPSGSRRQQRDDSFVHVNAPSGSRREDSFVVIDSSANVPSDYHRQNQAIAQLGNSFNQLNIDQTYHTPLYMTAAGNRYLAGKVNSLSDTMKAHIAKMFMERPHQETKEYLIKQGFFKSALCDEDFGAFIKCLLPDTYGFNQHI